MGLNKRLISTAAAGGGVVNTENFAPVTYTGNGSTQSISAGFQPDLVWLKSRETTRNHILSTSVQQQYNYLSTNLTIAEATSSARITSLDSNGFTVGSSANVNENNTDYVAWCFKGGGAAVSGSGTNVSSVTQSENAAAGFGIYRFTTVNSDNTNITINHNLNATPEMVISKETSGGGNWYIYHKLLGNNFYVQFNTNAKGFGSSAWGAGMTSSVIGARTAQSVDSGETHVAYAFHSVDGYQKVDSYTGSGSSGLEVTTGFQPRFLMIKGVDSGTSDNWFIFDSERGIGKGILPNQSAAEFNNSTAYGITFGSNSFTLNFGSGTTQLNTNGNDYIYLAIA